MSRSRDEIFSLGAEVGAPEMRRLKAINQFHSLELDAVDKWLSLEESSSKDRAEARDEETLSIAKNAISIARSASREVRKDRYIAIAAVMIAAIAAHKEIMWLISSVRAGPTNLNNPLSGFPVYPGHDTPQQNGEPHEQTYTP